jgi:hypothetical protein
VSAPPSPSSRYIMILMLFDLQYLIISLTQDRIDKILSCLRYICSNLQTTRVIPVGLLASVIGQLISTKAVLGKSVRLRTRYAYDCVLGRFLVWFLRFCYLYILSSLLLLSFQHYSLTPGLLFLVLSK